MLPPPVIVVSAPFLEPLVHGLKSRYDVRRWWVPHDMDAAARGARLLVVGGPVTVAPSMVESFPQLGLIACATAGYECIDVAHARDRGIVVTHGAAAPADDVADFALGLIIASVRRIIDADTVVRSGEWRGGAGVSSRSLAGLRVGVVGLGEIGRRIAERCEYLRMSPRWWGPRPKPGARWSRAEDLTDLARTSDVLVLSARATYGAAPLIGAAELDAIGPEGLLVNVARGQLVDERELIAALRTGRLGAAALDVFSSEPTEPGKWAGLRNVILAPHCAGATPATVSAMAALLAANIDAFCAGRPTASPIRW